MIRLPLKPFVRMKLLKVLCWLFLSAWAITASVWAYRNRPEIILIGLDDAGTRIITSAGDPIIAKERLKFVREFLRQFYNYDSPDYLKTMSEVGSLMSDTFWREKEPEIKRVAEQMKEKPLTQTFKLLDLRQVSDDEFEADLAIYIRSRLQERSVKYRVVLNIAPKKRSIENPYPLEVVSIHETEI